MPAAITDGIEIRVDSNNPTHADAGNLSLSFTSVLTVADNNGSSEDFTASATSVTMTVIVNDPCDITTLDALALSAATITIIDGDSSYIEWDVPTVEADTRLDGTDLCDAVEFEVFADTADTAVAIPGWAAVSTETTGKIRLTVDTANVDLIDAEASVGYTLQIRSRLTNYPDRKHYTEVAVTINAATCDCQYLLWQDVQRVAGAGETPSSVTETIMVETPGPVTLATPTPDALTGLTHAAFQKCFAGGADECPRTGRYAAASDLLLDGAALPAWITFTAVGADELYTGSAQTITVDPTYAERGVHVITGTYTPTHGTALTGFVLATITIECHVASFTVPTNPADLEYTIYDQQLSLDMAALEYVQSPACNYPYTVVFSWDSGTDTVISGSTAGLLAAHSIT